MNKNPVVGKNSRHLPAFILLFLREKPGNGADLLNRMEAEMPHSFADSAGVYRALQALEADGSLVASWEVQESGTPRKIYTITPEGKKVLKDFAEDIRMRQENLVFFLKRMEDKNHG